MARMSNHARRSGAANAGHLLKNQRIDIGAAPQGGKCPPITQLHTKTAQEAEQLNSY
jgi:hypothetical protein